MAGRSIAAHLRHHVRFYCAALLGLGVYFFAPLPQHGLRILAAGDVFFVVYLLAMAAMAAQVEAETLRARAAREDEGIAIVILIVLVTIAFCCVAVIEVLNQKLAPAVLPLGMALIAAPLGWLTLHTVAAFHYANLFYAPAARRDRSGADGPLVFPGTSHPGAWDFLYYAFVVGMTAQVSDVQITSTKLRRATLGHAVVSFGFNTAIIAMAVNAVVVIAS